MVKIVVCAYRRIVYTIEYCKIESENNKELWAFSVMKQKPIYTNQKPTGLDVKKYYKIRKLDFIEIEVSSMKKIISDNEKDKRNSYKFKFVNLFKKYKLYSILTLIFFVLFISTISSSSTTVAVSKPEIDVVENTIEISKEDINTMTKEQIIELLNQNVVATGDSIENVVFKDLSGKEYQGEFTSGTYIVEASISDETDNTASEKFVISIPDVDTDGDKIYDEQDENPDVNDTKDTDNDGVLDKNDKYADKDDIVQAKEDGKSEQKKAQQESAEQVTQEAPLEAEPIEQTQIPQENIQADPSIYYENCDAVRAAGADPIHRGDLGYDTHLDRDGDGIGCE